MYYRTVYSVVRYKKGTNIRILLAMVSEIPFVLGPGISICGPCVSVVFRALHKILKSCHVQREACCRVGA